MKRCYLQRLSRILALVALPVFLVACSGAEGEEGSGEQQPAAPIPAVEAVQARYGSLPLRERLTGTVRATGQVGIYPNTSGPIVSVLAQDGDYVQRGEALVQIRPQTSQSQLAQAQANLSVAKAAAQQAQANLQELKTQFKRTEALAADSLVSVEALETQRAQLQAAEARYAQAQAEVQRARAAVQESEEAVSQTVVRAPVSGRVGQRNAEVGMMASGQTRLFTIGRLDQVKVEVPVTQEMLGKLEEGQRVAISAEGIPDSLITAEVSRISPFLEEGSYSASAEIDVSNPGNLLKPGMFVTVDVFYGESQQATLVPKSALYEDPSTGSRGVYVASSLGSEIIPEEPSSPNDQAPLTPPTPMQFRDVEVLAEGRALAGVRGIDRGTWVVVVGQHLLQNGQGEAKVRPTTWNNISKLQRLQRQDLLRQFMEKQQQLAEQMADSARAAADSVGATSVSM